MNILETLKLALSAIWAHKLRSFLTLLGMIIGVTAFMLVFSLLQGFNAYIDEKIAGVGSNSFTVRRFNFDDFKDTDTIAAAQRRNKELTFAERDYIRERAQLIDKIGVKAFPNSAEVKRGTETLRDVKIEGCEPVVAEIEKVDVAEGRYFNDIENNNSLRVAFVGADVSTKLFPSGSAVGQEINIRGIPYTVVGVQVAKGTIFGMPQDNFVQLPIRTYGANFGGLIRSRQIYFVVTAKSDKLYNDTVEEVRTLMRTRRKLPFADKDNFGIMTPDAITGLRDRMFGLVAIIALAVPSIALIVGAIVIMNIMLVSVTERTKEIGIRKSLGAKRVDILRQFLFEASVLALSGGIIGLIIAEILGIFVSRMLLETRISLLSGLLAIVVSGGIGVLSGLYPAWRAAKLDPIEALRTE